MKGHKRRRPHRALAVEQARNEDRMSGERIVSKNSCAEVCTV
ncbi:hypothetical protein ACWEO2_18435 [Nocardia sp. NPDC004278]